MLVSSLMLDSRISLRTSNLAQPSSGGQTALSAYIGAPAIYHQGDVRWYRLIKGLIVVSGVDIRHLSPFVPIIH